MAKIRVHELAKEMGIPTKEMVMTIQNMGIDIKNHFSTLEDSQVEAISARVSKPKGTAEPERRDVSDKPMDKPAARPGEATASKTANAEAKEKVQERAVPEKPSATRPPAPSQKTTRPPSPSPAAGRPRTDQGPVFESGPRPGGQNRTQDNQRTAGQRPQEGQRPQDGQRPYQPGQQRQPYQGGQRPPYQGGQRPQDGQRPPYQGGQRPPGQRQDGQRQPYQGGQRPPYQGGQRPQDGQRPPYQGGQRPPGQRQDGQRPPYQGGQRPPGQRTQDGQRPFTPGSGTSGTAGRPAGDTGPKKPFRSPKAGPPKQDRRDHRPQGKPVVAGRPLTGLEKMAPSEIAEIDTSGMRTVPVKATPRVQAPRPQAPARPAGSGPVRDYSRKMRKPKHKKKKESDRQETPSMITVGSLIQVRELADEMGKSPAEIVKKLMELGIMATINQEIDFETVEILASLYEVEVQKEVSQAEKMLEDVVDDEGSLKARPPIVTVMGHVDHGKTSLLDRIRQAEVAIGEAGGITQHIGAYQVKVNEQRITFIDTPGHEAFTAMRARGANVTDIAILVVAADDGVMPQTVEAISHIRAAKVPVIVAINKIDKPGANPERIMQQLTEYNLIAEEYGGDTVYAQVSAKAGTGIEHLLEMVLLVAEMNDIKANPDRSAEGFVLEGKLDKGRGPVATVIIQKGTLRTGDTVISGSYWCKVRAMTDHKGRRVEEAYPSMPVEITGWTGVPEAGEKVQSCDEKIAKQICEIRMSEKKIEEQKQVSRVSLDDFFKKMKDAEVKELNLIIKGDVQGSVEALTQSLIRLSTDEVKVHVIHSAAGAITETDVMLASASNAIIIGFNVRPDVKSRKYAEDENIDVRLYRVIYEAIQDVRKAMEGLLEPEYREKYLGRVEVRATFKVPNIGTVAGAYVIDGKIQRQAPVRILRDGVIIYEGKISSLKRFKDDVKEVLQNYECGIGVQDFNDIKEGDIIEAYEMEAIARELS